MFILKCKHRGLPLSIILGPNDFSLSGEKLFRVGPSCLAFSMMVRMLSVSVCQYGNTDAQNMDRGRPQDGLPIEMSRPRLFHSSEIPAYPYPYSMLKITWGAESVQVQLPNGAAAKGTRHFETIRQLPVPLHFCDSILITGCLFQFNCYIS